MIQIFGVIIAAIFGAIFGSYSTLFAYRLPRGESCFGRYFGQKSRCPTCNTTIRTRELVPVLNWLFTLGKCKTCKAKIPKTHLFLELFCTVFAVLCYLKFSFTEQFILYFLIVVGCGILLVTDFTHKVFSFQILIFLTILSIVNRVLVDQTIIDAIFSSAVGAVCAIIFYNIFYTKTTGFFSTQTQSFDYTKFILIASLCLNITNFLLYFFTVMIIFTTMLLFNVPNRKINFGFGYALIIPFLWLILN